MAKTQERLTKKDLRKLFCRFAFDYNRCGNFTNWHGTSYGYAMIPLLMTIAISLTGSEGSYSVVGPIFYMVAIFVILLAYGHFLFMKGYQLGRNAVQLIAGSAITKVREAIQVFGVILVGGLSASYCKPQTILAFTAAEGAEPTQIQTIIDGVFPNLLGLCLVLLCYWLLTKKKVSTFAMLLILMAATVGLAYAQII